MGERRVRSGNSSALTEKIILPGDRDRLGCVTRIRVRATCQRDETSLRTSKFESDMASQPVVGMTVVQAHAAHVRIRASVDEQDPVRLLNNLHCALLVDEQHWHGPTLI